jgi:transcription elongation GreA/GreB family factor
MVPRGVQAVALDTPLARALLDAAEGDVVELQLDGRSQELEIVGLRGPGRWSDPAS